MSSAFHRLALNLKRLTYHEEFSTNIQVFVLPFSSPEAPSSNYPFSSNSYKHKSNNCILKGLNVYYSTLS